MHLVIYTASLKNLKTWGHQMRSLRSFVFCLPHERFCWHCLKFIFLEADGGIHPMGSWSCLGPGPTGFSGCLAIRSSDSTVLLWVSFPMVLWWCGLQNLFSRGSPRLSHSGSPLVHLITVVNVPRLWTFYMTVTACIDAATYSFTGFALRLECDYVLMITPIIYIMFTVAFT